MKIRVKNRQLFLLSCSSEKSKEDCTNDSHHWIQSCRGRGNRRTLSRSPGAGRTLSRSPGAGRTLDRGHGAGRTLDRGLGAGSARGRLNGAGRAGRSRRYTSVRNTSIVLEVNKISLFARCNLARGLIPFTILSASIAKADCMRLVARVAFIRDKKQPLVCGIALSLISQHSLVEVPDESFHQRSVGSVEFLEEAHVQVNRLERVITRDVVTWIRRIERFHQRNGKGKTILSVVSNFSEVIRWITTD